MITKTFLFILFVFSLTLTSTTFADWNGNPYIEYRHALLSNEPSIIGARNCPCYGYEAIAGFEINPFGIDRWKLDLNTKIVGQTRWDDPEIYQFNVASNLKINRRLNILFGYRETHNLDRPTPLPTQYMDYQGLHEGNGFAWSGTHYLWTGLRWTFR